MTTTLPARNLDACILREDGFTPKLIWLTLKSAVVAAWWTSFCAAIIITSAVLMNGAIEFEINRPRSEQDDIRFFIAAISPFMYLYGIFVLMIGAIPLSILTVIPNFIFLVALARRWKTENVIGEDRIIKAGRILGLAVYLCFLAMLVIPFSTNILNGAVIVLMLTVLTCTAFIPAAFRAGNYATRGLVKLLAEREKPL